MKTKSLSDYTKEVIETLVSEKCFGTAHIYRYALQSFARFLGKEDIPFTHLNKVQLQRYETFLETEGKALNTISTYMRTLRAIYNRAADQEIIHAEWGLFRHVFTGVKAEKKRALKGELMHRLLKEELPAGTPSRIRETRDLLALMLLLQGIGFADLVHLMHKQLKCDSFGEYTLYLRRKKTGKDIEIQVSPQAMEIIRRYQSKDASSPYLLRFIDGQSEGETAYKSYCRLLRMFNYYLSQLPKYCQVENVEISSYTARHTWATLAKFCEVPEEIISEGLGHASLEVTRTYLKSFDNKKTRKANEIIANYVFNGIVSTWNSR